MTESLIDVATKAASKYARAVFWADKEELRQEAVLAALDAFRTWDEECGVPLNAYAWRACVLHLRAFCWRQSAPVHGDSRRPEGLRGLHRAEVVETTIVSSEDAFDLLAEKRWLEDVQGEMQYLFDGLGDDGALAACVLIREEAPAEVARAHSLKVERVYRAARNARALCADNARLYQMLKEKVG